MRIAHGRILVVFAALLLIFSAGATAVTAGDGVATTPAQLSGANVDEPLDSPNATESTDTADETDATESVADGTNETEGTANETEGETTNESTDQLLDETGNETGGADDESSDETTDSVDETANETVNSTEESAETKANDTAETVDDTDSSTEESADTVEDTADTAEETADETATTVNETSDTVDETTKTSADTVNDTTKEASSSADETANGMVDDGGATDEITETAGETTDEAAGSVNETTDTVDETANETTDITGETTNETTDITGETTNETTDAVEETTDAADEATDEATDTVDETTGTVNETTDTVDETVDETTDTVSESGYEIISDPLEGVTESVNGSVDGSVNAAGSTSVASDESDDLVGGSMTLGAGDADSRDTDSDGSTLWERRRSLGKSGSDASGEEKTREERDEDDGSGVVPFVGVLGAAVLKRPEVVAVAAAGAGLGATLLGTSATVAGSTASAASVSHGASTLFARSGPLLERLSRFVLLFGFGRHRDADPLEHETRSEIYHEVVGSPGVNLSALAERTDASMSTVRHHLRVLAEENLISTDKVNGKRRYYPFGTDDPELLAALDDGPRADVLRALHGTDGANVSTLADELGRDPSTVSHHLSKLSDAGFVEQERRGRAVVSTLTPDVERALVTPAGEPGAASAAASDD